MKVSIENVRAAGAYVLVDGLYAFALGWKLYEGKIPIFRLGGGCEENETGWECARREAQEEAGIEIQPDEPGRTFAVFPDEHDLDLHEIEWDRENQPGPQPVLAAIYRKNGQTSTSLMYLAHTDQVPMPSSEVGGILLLDEARIQRICESPTTLADYLNSGGKAAFRDRFDESLVLEPLLQLRVLGQLLNALSIPRGFRG